MLPKSPLNKLFDCFTNVFSTDHLLI